MAFNVRLKLSRGIAPWNYLRVRFSHSINPDCSGHLLGTEEASPPGPALWSKSTAGRISAALKGRTISMLRRRTSFNYNPANRIIGQLAPGARI